MLTIVVSVVCGAAAGWFGHMKFGAKAQAAVNTATADVAAVQSAAATVVADVKKL
jgi:hypothetical protein